MRSVLLVAIALSASCAAQSMGVSTASSVSGESWAGIQSGVSTKTVQIAAAKFVDGSLPESELASSAITAPRAMIAPVRKSSTPVQPVVRAESAIAHKKLWITLSTAQHGSAVFDAWSTRQAISSGHAYERDVLLKPFADSNAIYPALQVVPIGLDLLSHRMLRNSNGISRRTWWVPQALATAGFVWCGTRNLRVAH